LDIGWNYLPLCDEILDKLTLGVITATHHLQEGAAANMVNPDPFGPLLEVVGGGASLPCLLTNLHSRMQI
jgi:hypothetical protein